MNHYNHVPMELSNYLKKLYGNPTDEKYTPGYGVLPIIKYIPEGKTVWCPFDTEHSEFVLKFRDAGFHVVHSHICNGRIFSTMSRPNGTCSCPIRRSAERWKSSTAA